MQSDALSFTEQDWDELMNLSMKTTFFFPAGKPLAKHFIKENNGGKIINIASILTPSTAGARRLHPLPVKGGSLDLLKC